MKRLLFLSIPIAILSVLFILIVSPVKAAAPILYNNNTIAVYSNEQDAYPLCSGYVRKPQFLGGYACYQIRSHSTDSSRCSTYGSPSSSSNCENIPTPTVRPMTPTPPSNSASFCAGFDNDANECRDNNCKYTTCQPNPLSNETYSGCTPKRDYQECRTLKSRVPLVTPTPTPRPVVNRDYCKVDKFGNSTDGNTRVAACGEKSGCTSYSCGKDPSDSRYYVFTCWPKEVSQKEACAAIGSPIGPTAIPTQAPEACKYKDIQINTEANRICKPSDDANDWCHQKVREAYNVFNARVDCTSYDSQRNEGDMRIRTINDIQREWAAIQEVQTTSSPTQAAGTNAPPQRPAVDVRIQGAELLCNDPEKPRPSNLSFSQCVSEMRTCLIDHSLDLENNCQDNTFNKYTQFQAAPTSPQAPTVAPTRVAPTAAQPQAESTQAPLPTEGRLQNGDLQPTVATGRGQAQTPTTTQQRVQPTQPQEETQPTERQAAPTQPQGQYTPPSAETQVWLQISNYSNFCGGNPDELPENLRHIVQPCIADISDDEGSQTKNIDLDQSFDISWTASTIQEDPIIYLRNLTSDGTTWIYNNEQVFQPFRVRDVIRNAGGIINLANLSNPNQPTAIIKVVLPEKVMHVFVNDREVNWLGEVTIDLPGTEGQAQDGLLVEVRWVYNTGREDRDSLAFNYVPPTSEQPADEQPQPEQPSGEQPEESSEPSGLNCNPGAAIRTCDNDNNTGSGHKYCVYDPNGNYESDCSIEVCNNDGTPPECNEASQPEPEPEQQQCAQGCQMYEDGLCWRGPVEHEDGQCPQEYQDEDDPNTGCWGICE